MEDLLRIIQQATGYFLTSFDQINDITNEKERRRIYQIITSTLEQLGQQVNQVVPSSIVDEYAAGFTEAGALMVSGGAANVRGNLTTAVHVEAVQFLAQATVDDLQASFRTASTLGIANIEMDLKEIQDKMAQGILVGSAKRVTTTRVQKAFREKGLTSFITSDNKKLPLDFYAMTVVRTKQKQAQMQGAANRYKENGVKYVQIGERHPTCHKCASRNGLIVAFEPNDEGVPTVDEIGGLPPFHPNCRHTIRPIMSLEGRTIRPFRETDPRTPAQKKAYDLEQRIRVKANAEKKQFMNLQAAIGAEAPKTLAAFRRMKRANDDSWKAVQAKYRNVIGQMERGAAINPILGFPPLPKAQQKTILDQDHFDMGFRKNPSGTELFQVQGQFFGTKNISLEERGHLESLAAVRSKKDFTALWYKLEDEGKLTEKTNKIFNDVSNRYKLKESLFNVPDYRVGFGREDTRKLGEGLDGVDSVTDAEKWAIQNYTGSQSTVTNEYYRKGRTEKNEAIEELSRDLDSAIDKASLKENVMLYRGAGYPALGREMAMDILNNGNASKYIGYTIQDKGYMSTSLGAMSRFDSDVVFQIKAPKGTKGLYVEDWTATMGENEVILPRGTTLKIVDIVKNGSKLEMLMEVVQ
jgi:hypothetical protein